MAVTFLQTLPHKEIAPACSQTKPVEPPAKPKETPPEPQKKEKLLDLPIKPNWRTTGEYPLIAGVWSVVENKGTLVTVVQHGGDFVATASYKSGEETVTWRAEGKISRSGHVTMSLVHTQPHPPDKWLPQTRTAVLGLHGKFWKATPPTRAAVTSSLGNSWRRGVRKRRSCRGDGNVAGDLLRRGQVPTVRHHRRSVVSARKPLLERGDVCAGPVERPAVRELGSAQDDLEKAWAAMRNGK